MSKQILQINFQFAFSDLEYEKKAEAVANHFTGVPGLVWKIWLLNKDRNEAGGIYLFENAEALNEYLRSPLFLYLGTNPEITNIEVKKFNVLFKPGGFTNAPVESMLAHGAENKYFSPLQAR